MKNSDRKYKLRLGKVTSLPRVIGYVKRSKYSFHEFSAKHTPNATLKNAFVIHCQKDKYCSINSDDCTLQDCLNVLNDEF